MRTDTILIVVDTKFKSFSNLPDPSGALRNCDCSNCRDTRSEWVAAYPCVRVVRYDGENIKEPVDPNPGCTCTTCEDIREKDRVSENRLQTETDWAKTNSRMRSVLSPNSEAISFDFTEPLGPIWGKVEEPKEPSIYELHERLGVQANIVATSFERFENARTEYNKQSQVIRNRLDKYAKD